MPKGHVTTDLPVVKLEKSLEFSPKKLFMWVFKGAEHNGGVHFGQFEGQIGQIGNFSKVGFVITSTT